MLHQIFMHESVTVRLPGLSGAVVVFEEPSGAGCKGGDCPCGLEAGVRSRPIGFFGSHLIPAISRVISSNNPNRTATNAMPNIQNSVIRESSLNVPICCSR